MKGKRAFLILVVALFLLGVGLGCGKAEPPKATRGTTDNGASPSVNPAPAPADNSTAGSTGKTPSSPAVTAPPTGDSAAPKMPGDAQFYERRNSGGGVDMEVIWLTPEYLQARGQKPTADEERDLRDNLVFDVALTTHSGDLLSFDMAGAARLEVDGRDAGRATWELSNPDSHHAEGLLRFTAGSGSKPARELTLTITNLRGVAQRTFTWSLSK